jgi:arylsulfatase A
VEPIPVKPEKVGGGKSARKNNMKLLKWIGLAGIVGMSAFTCARASAPPQQPNFIIFLADDLGYGDLGSYGHPFNSTPQLDRFAAEGVRLTDCHSGGTVCSPSRAAILTGRNPYRSGFSYILGGKTFLKNDELTLAELLKQQGYQTGFFGKWHLSKLEDATQPNPGAQGFDYWLATSQNTFEGPRNPLHFVRNGKKTGVLDGWYCDIIVKESLEWLSGLDTNRPFFMVVSTQEPHTPLAPPESLAKTFLDPKYIPLIKGLNYGGVDRDGKFNLTNAAQYFGTVKQLDNAFGTFIHGLDRSGSKDNTLVFFTSDNGPESPVNFEESRGEWADPIRDNCYGTPGPFKGMKRFPYEGGHRVPGLVRWPKVIPAGIVSDQLVNGTDLLPIFCGLAGVEVPPDRKIDGAPVFDALLGKPVARKEPVLWVFPAHGDSYERMPHLAMRQGEHVLVGWFPQKKAEEKIQDWMKASVPVKFQLFDIGKDPGETNDLTQALPAVTKELTGAMIRLWRDLRQSDF